MKPLSRLQSLAFTLGGLLLLVGALLPMVPSLSDFAPYVFCAGALLFGTLQLVQRYEGRNVTVRRLRRQQMLGACLLMISACLLLVTAFRLLPLRGGEWKVALAIAAVLELYTAFRLPAATQSPHFTQAVPPYCSTPLQLLRPLICRPGSCLYNRVPLVSADGPAFCTSTHAARTLRNRKTIPRATRLLTTTKGGTARQLCKESRTRTRLSR